MAGKRAAAALRTRAAVLIAAKTLFEHHGYDAVTIRQVAKEAGMSTGSIFAHFDGKAALFEAAMGRPAPDAAAFLKELCEHYLALTDPAKIGALLPFAYRADILRKDLTGNG